MILDLALLFQLSDPEKRSIMEELERSRDIVAMQQAREKDANYKKAVLKARHIDFIQKFNAYLADYRQGISSPRKLAEAVKAWNILKDTEGFDYARSNSR